MLKIAPEFSLGVKIANVLSGVILAAVQGGPDHFGGKAAADNITFWIGLGIAVVNGLYSCVGTGAQPSVTLAGKVE